MAIVSGIYGLSSVSILLFILFIYTLLHGLYWHIIITKEEIFLSWFQNYKKYKVKREKINNILLHQKKGKKGGLYIVCYFVLEKSRLKFMVFDNTNKDDVINIIKDLFASETEIPIKFITSYAKDKKEKIS